MDWDEAQSKTAIGPAIGENIEALSVAELDSRIALLEDEIKRVVLERARKLQVGAAADQVFKS